MPEALFVRNWDQRRWTLTTPLGAGELVQVPGGFAGFTDGTTAFSSGESPTLLTSGTVAVPKTNGIVLLDGGAAYWDFSANALHYKAVNDRDFYAGTVVGDYASGDTLAYVNLNQRPNYLADFGRGWSEDAFITAITGTQALGGLEIKRRGAAHNFVLSSTSEVQKLDALGVNGFAPGAKWIVEGAFRVPSDGAGTVVDANIGIANATHATDADSITEHLFLHLDANNVNINLQSKDGTTTVAATDTTIDYTEGTALSTRVEFWFDGRNTADIQCYVNAALVLGASVFRLDNAVGPLFLLKHLEKTSAADTYEIALDFLRVRLANQ